MSRRFNTRPTLFGGRPVQGQFCGKKPPTFSMGWFNQFYGEKIAVGKNWVCQPTLFANKTMNAYAELAQILKLPTAIPNVPASYTHRIGFSNGGPRYTPPKPREPKSFTSSPDDLKGSHKKVYQVMKAQVKPISAVDMEKKTPWSRNHCNIIMAALTKKGLLVRQKARFNGTNIYFYSLKESS